MLKGVGRSSKTVGVQAVLVRSALNQGVAGSSCGPANADGDPAADGISSETVGRCNVACLKAICRRAHFEGVDLES